MNFGQLNSGDEAPHQNFNDRAACRWYERAEFGGDEVQDFAEAVG